MGFALTKVNEADVFLEGLGVRHVDVYEAHLGMHFTAYFDREVGWTIKLEMSHHFHMNFDVELSLIETNIPRLKT